MIACDTATENSGRMLKCEYGLIWIIRMPMRSSCGSIQNSVPLAPPQVNVPIESASGDFAGSVRTREAEAEAVAVAADVDRLAGADLVGDHHVDGHPAEQPLAVVLAAVQQHLREAEVVGGRAVQPGDAGEIGRRLAVLGLAQQRDLAVLVGTIDRGDLRDLLAAARCRRCRACRAAGRSSCGRIRRASCRTSSRRGSRRSRSTTRTASARPAGTRAAIRRRARSLRAASSAAPARPAARGRWLERFAVRRRSAAQPSVSGFGAGDGVSDSPDVCDST